MEQKYNSYRRIIFDWVRDADHSEMSNYSGNEAFSMIHLPVIIEQMDLNYGEALNGIDTLQTSMNP